MPIEGWRSLLTSTTWGDCAVTLHNLPFRFNKEIVVRNNTKIISYSSIYELQKSAAFWDLPDFKKEYRQKF